MNARPVPQSESAVCGLACLTMLSGAHGLSGVGRQENPKSQQTLPVR